MKHFLQRIIFLFSILAITEGLHAQSLPDLVNTDVSINGPVIQAGHLINLSYKTRNLGNANCTYSYSGYYLSADAVKDASDQLLGYDYEDLIRPGDSVYGYNVFYTAASTPAGNYYLLVVSDFNNTVIESSETNNTTALPITIGPVNADVELLNITSPQELVAGEFKSVDLELINHGPSSISAGFVCALSTDTILSQNDPLIGTSPYNYYLTQNYSTSANAGITIPRNTAPGAYYLLYMADYLGMVNESNEVNNLKYFPLTIVQENVDLMITSVNISPQIIESGADCNITFDLVNLGSTDVGAGATDVYFYISKDTVYDQADIGFYYPYSSNATMVGLNDTANMHVHVMKNISTNIAPGNYYMLLVTDQYNMISETNNVNNTAFFPITIVPQFTNPASYDAHLLSGSITGSPLAAGRYATINASVHYPMHSQSTPVYVQLRLSSDTIFDNMDLYVGNEYVNFTTSDTGQISTSLMLPQNITGGTYYMLYNIGNLPGDPDLSNNRIMQQVTIQNGAYDLRVNPVEISASLITPGNQLTIVVDGYNDGIGHLYSFQTAYYLSTDTVLDASDIFLQTSYGSFGATDSTRIGSYLYIPLTAGYGTRYLLCEADYKNFIQEVNENNNVCYFPVNIVPPDVDLAFYKPVPFSSNIYIPSYIQWDENIVNYGTTPTNSTYASYYISADTLLDNSDQYIFSNTIGTINAGSSHHTTNSHWVGNMNISGGSFYLISRLDTYNNISETNESNNITWTYFQLPPPPSIEISPGLPMLSKSQDVKEAGVRITTKIFNNGISMSGNVTTKYFISTDSVYSLNDILLRDMQGYNLYPADFEVQSFDIVFPYQVTTGNYYIIVVTDPDNLVNESNESNNIRAVPYTIIPSTKDFSIDEALIVPANIIAGRSVSAYYNIHVTGTQSPYYNPQVTLVLSADTVLSIDDVQITNVGSYQNSAIIPENIPDGNYYILFNVDFQNYYAETNENNNMDWYQVTVQHEPTNIDIVVSAASNSLNARAGENIDFSCAVENIGTTPVYNTIATAYYLSTDTVWGEADIFLPRISQPYSFVAYLQLPEVIPPGNYYIIYFADYTSTYGESNEFNNTRAVPITIVPSDVDFIPVATPGFPALLKTNTQPQVNISVRNAGNNESGSFATSIYLSNDTIFGYSDRYIGGVFSDAINSNDTMNRTATIYMGDDIAPGQYYVLIVADQSDYNGSPVHNVLESNENNNTLAIPVTVQRADVDLMFIDLMAPLQTGISGTSLPFEFKALNNGNDQSRATYMNYFLSIDTILSQGDVNIGSGFSQQVNPIEGHSSTLFNTSLNLWPPSSGSYFILLQMDKYDECTETNEDNNIAWYPITILDPGEDSSLTNVDLEVLSPGVASSIVPAGSQLNVSSVIHNIGPSVVNDVRVEYYLSTDAVYSPDDHFFYSAYISQLSGGGSQSKSDMIYIPGNTPAGNYYMLFVTYSMQVNDRNYGNNMSSLPLQIIAPGPQTTDLAAQGQLTGTGTIYPGSSQGFTSTLSNHVMHTSHFRVNYCLSKDIYFDNVYQDIRLSQEIYDSIPAMDSMIINPALKFPMTVEPGNYFILTVIEPDYNVVDFDTTNNIAIVPVTIVPANNDLSIPSVMVPGDTIHAGSSQVSTNVFNGGLSTSYETSMGYYLSTDAVLSSDDVYLQNTALNSLSSMDDTIIPKFITVPSYVPPGDYYLLNYADYLSKVIETDEYNNINSTMVNVGVVGILPIARNENRLLVFPNPNAGKFTLLLKNNSSGEINIYNELGVLMKHEQIRSRTGNIYFNLEGSPPGIYILRFISGKDVYMTKLMIQ